MSPAARVVSTPAGDQAELNVLFVTFDQLRRDALRCLGGHHDIALSTPNFDAVAAEGVTFANHSQMFIYNSLKNQVGYLNLDLKQNPNSPVARLRCLALWRESRKVVPRSG